METDAYEQYSRKRTHDTTTTTTNEEVEDGYVADKRSTNTFAKPSLKYLVPNFMAGKLIGKGGSNIGELQTKYNAFIQMSPNGEYYPGTGLRIVSVSAEMEQLKEFTNYLIQMVDEEERSDRRNPELKSEVQLVVSNIAAGLVLGKGGASIKAIQSSSNGANIALSRKEESVNGERVICVSGNVSARLSACQQILDIMSAEPDKMSSSTIKYHNNMKGGNAPPMRSHHHHQPQPPPHQTQAGGGGTGGMPGFNPQASSSYNTLANLANVINNAMSSLTNQSVNNNTGSNNYVAKSGAKAKFKCEIEMPEKLAGTIIGRGGKEINEIARVSGARLQFSSKDDYAPGLQNRVLSIQGETLSQVQNAYMIVDERLSLVEHEFDYPFRQMSHHVEN